MAFDENKYAKDSNDCDQQERRLVGRVAEIVEKRPFKPVQLCNIRAHAAAVFAVERAI